MSLTIYKDGSLAIVYDDSLLALPDLDFFRPGYWESENALNGQATGRGSAWFIDAPFGAGVLRQYLRGGWAAKFSRNKYFFSRVSRSRPFREFRLLATLHEQGLPVPRPVAAMCEYHGLLSSGAIMTIRIPLAETLASWVAVVEFDSYHRCWAKVGQSIRRFHDAGVWHADLNARNILLNPAQQVFMLDFDRARFKPGQKVNGKSNLARLKRSLLKLWPADQIPAMQVAWMNLMDGYHG